MFSYDLITCPWDYYFLTIESDEQKWDPYLYDVKRIDDIWGEYNFVGRIIAPGDWKDKDTGFYVMHCGDTYWNKALMKAIIARERCKRWYKNYALKNKNLYYQAFSMGTQRRIGSASIILSLNYDTIDLICSLVDFDDYLSCFRYPRLSIFE